MTSISRLATSAAFAIVSSLTLTSAQSEEVVSDLELQVQELQAELDLLRNQVLGHPVACCNSSPQPRKWRDNYVGGSISILRPHIGTVTADFDVAASPRFWLGTENQDGLGFRASAWYFDSALNVDLGGATIRNELRSYTVDLDVTQKAMFCRWNLEVFGGLRFGGLNNEFVVTVPPDTLTVDYNYDGAGVTMGFGFDRQIAQSYFDLYGNFRASFLYGGTTLSAQDNLLTGLGGAIDIVDQIVSVWEIQVGVEYSRPTRLGEVFLRAGIEGQVWEVPPVLLGIGDTNVGFFGPAFSIGIVR